MLLCRSRIDLAIDSGGWRFATLTSDWPGWLRALLIYNLPLIKKKTQIERIMTQCTAAFSHAVTARQYIDLYEKMPARPLIKTDVMDFSCYVEMKSSILPR